MLTHKTTTLKTFAWTWERCLVLTKGVLALTRLSIPPTRTCWQRITCLRGKVLRTQPWCLRRGRRGERLGLLAITRIRDRREGLTLKTLAIIKNHQIPQACPSASPS